MCWLEHILPRLYAARCPRVPVLAHRSGGAVLIGSTMPAKAAHDLPALPTDEEIDLADYKIGLFISDLNDIRHRIERLTNISSIEEALEARKRGEPVPATPPLDRDQLGRIVVFANDAIHDAEGIIEEARVLLGETIALYHEEFSTDRDLEGYKRHRRVVEKWHASEVDA